MQVAITLFPRTTALDSVGPYEVLQRVPSIDVVFVGHRRGEVRTENGMLGLTCDATFDEVREPDVLLVPGGVGTRELMTDEPVLDWVRAVHRNTRFTTSVCTGSLVLAAAGLLVCSLTACTFDNMDQHSYLAQSRVAGEKATNIMDKIQDIPGLKEMMAKMGLNGKMDFKAMANKMQQHMKGTKTKERLQKKRENRENERNEKKSCENVEKADIKQTGEDTFVVKIGESPQKSNKKKKKKKIKVENKSEGESETINK
jgi:putative intracellular protease/amidase